MSKRVEFKSPAGNSIWIGPEDTVSEIRPAANGGNYVTMRLVRDGCVRGEDVCVRGTVAEVRHKLGLDGEQPGTLTLVPIPESELWHPAEPVRITNTSELRVGDVVNKSSKVVGICDGRVFYWNGIRPTWDAVGSQVDYTFNSRLDDNGVSQPVTGERRRKTWKELYADGVRYWRSADSPDSRLYPITYAPDEEPIIESVWYRLVRN